MRRVAQATRSQRTEGDHDGCSSRPVVGRAGWPRLRCCPRRRCGRLNRRSPAAAHRPPGAGHAAQRPTHAPRSGVAAVGRQRRVRLHGGRHRAADVSEEYDKTIPLGTLSQWGGTPRRTPTAGTSTGSRSRVRQPWPAVGYATFLVRRTPEIEWLRANPHRLHLGRIGFKLTRADGSRATPADLSEVRQRSTSGTA